MGVSLTFATILAALAKESGLLLPVFVLVLELTILTRPSEVTASDWKKWSLVFLWLPGVLLLGYLASRSFYPDYLIARRGFNGGERLLTEARILWLYLSKALLGLPGRLGIYHADFAVTRSLWSPLTLLALFGWLAATFSAVVWRRRYPFFALAVLWFLAGHVIESTVVPLELYFEHRNYFPIIGPIIALTAFLFLYSEQIRRIALLVIPLVLLVNAWFLYSFASLLGDSSMASRYWAVQHPHSVRALTNLAIYQLAEESIEQGVATIHLFAKEHPRYAYIRIQELNLRCLTSPAAPLSKELGEIEVALSAVDFSYTAGEMLSQLFTTTTMVSCVDVRPETVMQLATALHSNPRYRDDPKYNQFHHKLLAGIYRHLGDAQAMRTHLDKAIRHRMSAELVMMMAMTMAEANEYAQAREFLSVAAEQTPRNPFWAVSWRQNIDDLHHYLDALEDQNLE
jgi:tetratricopeptide (TPR) repeat protein